ncbi:aminotransferase class V-fold PLP-dependent enzyme [Rathayibacter sp. KR2-224]|uniref:aminotransferase class V-fold PLP-dependent enzyme n=1 Tax=Rathayibacter sp. KR2-224 TaxID=3400913 RepID=UPI003C0BC3C7
MSIGLAPLREEFAGTGACYLAACTGGLPPASAADAMRRDLDLWRSGGTSPAYYDEAVSRSREAFARLAGVETDRVAIGSQSSVFAGMIAASVPDGAEVICVDGDFSSVVFPFLQHERRGVRVRHVPLRGLADAVNDATWLVVYSLVQSATGEVADAAGIRAAAARVGARVLCDATQAAGWMPLRPELADAFVCHAYKWLCSPRGVCFLTVTPDFAAELTPINAGWYAGEDPWVSCYGPSAPLASSARRFDVSPAWQAAAGAAPALELFASADIASVQQHDVGLADALAEALGLPTRGSAIVTWPDARGDDLRALSAAGIVASGRAGRARVAFHVWNDAGDVENALRVLGRSSERLSPTVSAGSRRGAPTR